jgi:hypothetical protein
MANQNNILILGAGFALSWGCANEVVDTSNN